MLGIGVCTSDYIILVKSPSFNLEIYSCKNLAQKEVNKKDIQRESWKHMLIKHLGIPRFEPLFVHGTCCRPASLERMRGIQPDLGNYVFSTERNLIISKNYTPPSLLINAVPKTREKECHPKRPPAIKNKHQSRLESDIGSKMIYAQNL